MSFNSVLTADNYLEFSIGDAAALGSGPYTIAVLVRPTAGNNNCGMVQLRADTSGERALLEDSLKLFGEGEFAGFGSLTQGNWYLCIVKAEDASTYSYDLWPYADDGSGSMSHGDSVFSTGDGAVADNMRIGWAINRGNGFFAVVALWDRKITNGEADTLKTNLLSAYAALEPVELISYENWDGTIGSEEVKIGSSTCTGIVGSCPAAANPPSFVFAVSNTVDLVIANATQAQSAGNVALTQQHQLVVSSANQAQSAQNVALSQVHVLGIQSARQTQSASNIGNLVPDAGTVSGAVTGTASLAGSVTASVVVLAGTIE
jgi:hypothetical protein